MLWTVETSADPDVLLFAFRFAADIILYPEIATSLRPRRVADLFFDCFLDGVVIPGMEERASHIACILASILNIHACMGHDLEAIGRIGEQIKTLGYSHEDPDIHMARWSLSLASCEWIDSFPNHYKDTSGTFRIWLSQMILQSVYWRQTKAENRVYNIALLGLYSGSVAKGRRTLNTVFLNLILACAVSPRLCLNISDFHISDNSCVKPFLITFSLLIIDMSTGIRLFTLL